jgi:hypothetical protein
VKITRALAECLLKIRNLNEFEPFREMLAEEANLLKDQLVTQADDRALRNLQGRAQAITSLIDLIGDAEKLVDQQRR